MPDPGPIARNQAAAGPRVSVNVAVAGVAGAVGGAPVQTRVDDEDEVDSLCAGAHLARYPIRKLTRPDRRASETGGPAGTGENATI